MCGVCMPTVWYIRCYSLRHCRQLMFENMTEKQREEGVHGDDYATEKQTFETATLKKFNTLLVRDRTCCPVRLPFSTVA